MIMANMILWNLKPQIFLILRVAITVFNVTSETFNVFYYFLGILILLWLGVFIVIFLLYFLIILVYNILYYLISKIDWINNKKNKEFALIEKKSLYYI